MSESGDLAPKDLPYGRRNWHLGLAGLGTVGLGYACLSVGPAEGFLSLTLAPLLLVAGYCVVIPWAILYRDGSADDGETMSGKD